MTMFGKHWTVALIYTGAMQCMQFVLISIRTIPHLTSRTDGKKPSIQFAILQKIAWNCNGGKLWNEFKS